jgi:hypothetical protein
MAALRACFSVLLNQSAVRLKVDDGIVAPIQ